MEKSIEKCNIRPSIKVFVVVACIIGFVFFLGGYYSYKEINGETSFGWPFLTGLIPVVTIIPYGAIKVRNASLSSLILYETRIEGIAKDSFSTRTLNLPLNKVDAIYVEKGFMDICLGGKTVIVSSPSGKTGFQAVLNADDFRNKVLNRMVELEQNIKPTVVNVEPKETDDLKTKIEKLKMMLDEGLITEEEFAAKKKDLLERL